jgi:hypothetical protein
MISRSSSCERFSIRRVLIPQQEPDSPELIIKWYRQDPDDWFRINYTDSNTGFHAGWHQDKDHPDLGQAHFQYPIVNTEDRWGIRLNHEAPSLILWEIIEDLLENVHPKYNRANKSTQFE